MKRIAQLVHHRIVSLALVALPVLATCVPTATATEIRVRAESRPTGPIVTLGDLADLRSDSQEQVCRMAQIALFPAPAAGLERYVSVREIQDMLLIRGIDLIDHDFGGATRVIVRGVAPAVEVAPSVRLESAAPAKARRRLSEALEAFLCNWANEPWQLEFQLDSTAEKWIAAADDLAISSTVPPAVGRQNFQVELRVGQMKKTVAVETQLSLPPQVIVAGRALPRGGIIGAADVQLQRIAGLEDSPAYLRNIDDVVGKQTSRALAAGKPVERGWVQPQTLVRRGEVVTVYVRAGGVTVHTQARARDDGARGDLVMVESITDRRSYLAHVSGEQEVEVLGSGVVAREPDRSRPDQG